MGIASWAHIVKAGTTDRPGRIRSASQSARGSPGSVVDAGPSFNCSDLPIARPFSGEECRCA